MKGLSLGDKVDNRDLLNQVASQPTTASPPLPPLIPPSFNFPTSSGSGSTVAEPHSSADMFIDPPLPTLFAPSANMPSSDIYTNPSEVCLSIASCMRQPRNFIIIGTCHRRDGKFRALYSHILGPCALDPTGIPHHVIRPHTGNDVFNTIDGRSKVIRRVHLLGYTHGTDFLYTVRSLLIFVFYYSLTRILVVQNVHAHLLGRMGPLRMHTARHGIVDVAV
jgi:hypothetical protein